MWTLVSGSVLSSKCILRNFGICTNEVKPQLFSSLFSTSLSVLPLCTKASVREREKRRERKREREKIKCQHTINKEILKQFSIGRQDSVSVAYREQGTPDLEDN